MRAAWPSKYVGIPFREHGRDQSGCDCWGLARLVYAQELGIELPSFLGSYESTLDIARISVLHDAERQHWHHVPRPHEFDLVSLRVNGRPWHVGVSAGSGRVLHALRGCDAVLEPIDPVWIHRVDGYYRWNYHAI